MKLPTLFIASAFAVFAAPSQSAEVYFDTVSTAAASRLHGAYFGVFGGGANVNGTATSNRLNSVNVEGDGVGWVAGVEFGYTWATPVGLNFSAELELFYLNQDISGANSVGRSYDASLSAFAAMANGVVQLDLEQLVGGTEATFLSSIKPYFGAGVGGGYGYQDQIRYKAPGRSVQKPEDGGEMSFGYQVFGGVEVELAPEFSIYGEYKYLNFYDFGNGDIKGADLGLWVIGAKFSY